MANIASFALELTDGLSGPSKQAAASLERLKLRLEDAKGALSQYESKLRVANELGNVAGHERYSNAVQQSQRRVADLTSSLESAQAPSQGLVSSLGGIEGAAGPAGLAIGAVAAAVGLAVGAIETMIDVTERLTVEALNVTNANDQMRASFEALGGGGAGPKTLAMLDELGERLPQSREQLAKWTKQIEATGVTDLSKVRSELIATAAAQAIMGDEGANAYRKLEERVRLAVEAHHGLKLAEKSLKSLYEAGLNVTDIAQRMGMSTQELAAKLKGGTVDAQKFGDAMRESLLEKGKGPLEAMMNSLAVMAEKAKERYKHLFEGVDTAPLTDALHNLIALGDQGAPSGEAIKMGLVPAMNAVIRGIGSAVTEAEVFFLELEVDALEAYIALKPLIRVFNEIKEAAAPLTGLISGGVVNAPTLQASSGAAETAQSTGSMLGKLMLAAFTGPTALMTTTVHEALQEMGGAEAQAIANASGQSLGKATIAGVRQGLDAHSPSREAIKIGMDLSSGLGIGMVASAEPTRAAHSIATRTLDTIADAREARTIPANSPGRGPAADPQAAAAQHSTTIGPIHLTINAPDGVTDAHAISVTGLATVLERYQLGAGR